MFESKDFVFLAVFEAVGEERGVEILRGGVGDEAGTVSAAFYGGLDGGENGFGRKEVDAAIDEIANVGFGLLDVVQDPFCVAVRDDAAKVAGGVVADSCTQDDCLSVFVLEETKHFV